MLITCDMMSLRLLTSWPYTSIREPEQHHVAVPDGASVEQMLAAYRANPLVAEASAGHTATILDTPNDTNYLYQWHMHNSEGGMWADLAWNLAPNRGANVTVAVIDSGVAFEDYNTSLGGYPQTFKKAADLAGTTFEIGRAHV